MVSSEFSKLGELVSQDGEDEAGIEFRVAGLPGLELSVLIMLDQAVIRVAGKGERVEPEGVDQRFCKDLQTGTCFAQIGQIVADYVVPEHELGAGGVVVQRTQRGRKVALAINAGVGGCRTDGSEALNPAGVRIDFEVDRDAFR